MTHSLMSVTCLHKIQGKFSLVAGTALLPVYTTGWAKKNRTVFQT